MVYTATFDQQSNRADWIFQVTATDTDTNALVDFTDAAISCAIMDKNGTVMLMIPDTSSDSVINFIDANTLEFFFSKGHLGQFCGHYKIGCVYEKDDETHQLFIGTVSFYEGIARL